MGTKFNAGPNGMFGEVYTRQDTPRWFAFALRGGTVVSKSDDPGGKPTRADSVAAPQASQYATTKMSVWVVEIPVSYTHLWQTSETYPA